MEPSTILRVILLVTGILMLCVTIASLAKRKMNESFCLAWGVVSLSVFIAGIVLRPSEWQTYISGAGLALILVIFFGILYGAYFMSLRISELARKNQELAIQVSLINQENERIIRRLSEILDVEKRDV